MAEATRTKSSAPADGERSAEEVSLRGEVSRLKETLAETEQDRNNAKAHHRAECHKVDMVTKEKDELVQTVARLRAELVQANKSGGSKVRRLRV